MWSVAASQTTAATEHSAPPSHLSLNGQGQKKTKKKT